MKAYNREHINSLEELCARLKESLSNPAWRQDERQKIQKEIALITEMFQVCEDCQMPETYKPAHEIYETLLKSIKEVDEGLYNYFIQYKPKCSLSESLKTQA